MNTGSQSEGRPSALGRTEHSRGRWPTTLLIAIATAFICASTHAETSAAWITHPDAPANGRVTLHFRRDFMLRDRPDRALIQVSADNRFILFVNGQRVGAGPARGDPAHWRYETFDIAPYLMAGPNRITATVWNWGQAGPMAQMTARTGFYVHGVSPALSALDSGADWRVRIDKGYSVSSPLGRLIRMRWYYAAGPEEKIDAARRDWYWDDAKTDEATWQAAVSALKAGEASPWHLVPDQLPQMRFESVDPGHVVQTDLPADGFPGKALVVPAHRSVHILLDRGSVDASYPELKISGGAGATVKLTYAEALYDAANAKSDRAEVTGRHIVGIEDTFLADGGARSFAPLWWRVWRFLDIAVEAGDQPLTLEGLEVHNTGYPFVQKARFTSSDPELDRIWQIGWHTLQVDANETFMDSAYWEQLQYIGDARVEAEIASVGSGDPRLAVQAIDAFIDSRTDQGITQSRYPTRSPQAIPTFSLIFVGIVHDFWTRNPDTAVVRRSLPLIRSTLDWFGGYAQPDRLLRKVPDWSFVDWIKDGDRSYPSYDANQESCVTSLLYLGALDEAADLEAAAGEAGRGRTDRQSAASLRQAIYDKCWDAGRGLIADHPGKTVFSQDANVLAVLYDVVPKADQASFLAKAWPVGTVAPPEGLLPGSYYFGFYAARAYAHAGQADRYLDFLAPWRALLKQHFTTWPELREPTRSDSHAWSGHPTADLLEIVAGIGPEAPGFATVRIAPHLGALTSLDVAMPHPKGLIEARYVVDGGQLKAFLTLPAGLPGEFQWKGKTTPLHQGLNEITVKQ